MAVTQAQIAKLAGVSRGTVDRVVNRRGRVDPEVEARIRQIADELGYRRNRAGSLLVRSKRPIRLGVLLQSTRTPFMASVLEEIERARAAMAQTGAELLVRSYENIDLTKQLAVLQELEEAGVDGVALTPMEDERVLACIDRLAERGIPSVTFNTDMPGSQRLCYVGQDNYLSGRACAGLMNKLLRGGGKVLMLAGHLSNLSHRSRIEGFRSEAHALFPGLQLLPIERTDDDPQVAYEIVKRLMAEQPDIAGIYIAANGQSGVCNAIRELGLKGRVAFICHDLFDENIEHLREGLIDFVIDQNAQMQANRPLEVLTEYLLTGERPADEYMLAPVDIRTSYNV